MAASADKSSTACGRSRRAGDIPGNATEEWAGHPCKKSDRRRQIATPAAVRECTNAWFPNYTSHLSGQSVPIFLLLRRNSERGAACESEAVLVGREDAA